MPLPRAPIDLARRGAWSAETTHAPRVPDVAVAAHRRAQPIVGKASSRGVTSARAHTQPSAISIAVADFPDRKNLMEANATVRVHYGPISKSD